MLMPTRYTPILASPPCAASPPRTPHTPTSRLLRVPPSRLASPERPPPVGRELYKDFPTPTRKFWTVQRLSKPNATVQPSKSSSHLTSVATCIVLGQSRNHIMAMEKPSYSSTSGSARTLNIMAMEKPSYGSAEHAHKIHP